MIKKLLVTIFILILFVGTLNNVLPQLVPGLTDVYAKSSEEREDEDKEEDDERDEEREDDDKEYYETTTTETVLTPTPVTEPVTQYITSVEPGYNTDTDGDQLVDAIDPDPTIPQSEFYTDDDKDSVPNAFDKHKGEDDLSYTDFQDLNSNGILDSLEE
jgi:hypothetical protein